MGTFKNIARIASEILDPTGERLKTRLENERKKENDLIKMQADALIDSLKTRRVGPDGSTESDNDYKRRSEDTWAAINKLYSGSKSAKNVLGFAKEAHDIFGQHLAGPPSMQQNKQTDPNQPPQSGAQSGATAGTQSNVQSGQSLEEYLAPPSMDALSKQFDTLFPNAPVEQKMNWLAQRNVAGTSTPKAQIKPYNGEDGYVHYSVFDVDGTLVRDIRSDTKVQEKTFQVRTGRPISVNSARELHDTIGQPFVNEKGEEIPLDKLGTDLALYPVFQGNKTHYVVQSQRQPTVTFGNMVYAVPEFEKTSIPQGSATPLGQARVATASTHETPGLDAEGNPIALQLRSTATPATSVIPPAGQPAPAPAPAQPDIQNPPAPAASPVITPAVTPAATTAQNLPTTPSASSTTAGNKLTMQPAAKTAPTKPTTTASTTPRYGPGVRPLGGFKDTTYRDFTMRVIPIQEAANQTIGSPDHPNYKSLEKFAYLADNKEASKAIASAIRATLDRIKANEKVHGSLVNLIKLELGVPQTIINQEVAANREMIADKLKGHTDWMDAYDSLIASYATMMGMRAATKAPASQFTSESLEREIPVPGLYVGDSRAYYDKLAKIALEIENAARKMPTGIMGQNYKDFYNSRVKYFTDLSNRPITPPPSAAGTPSASSFWRNGDKGKKK